MNIKTLLTATTFAVGLLVLLASQARAQSMPFVRLADLQIEPAHVEAFKVAAALHAEAMLREEPGAVALHVVAEKANPGRIRVLEIYRDREAYAAHLRTPHFARFRVSTESMTLSRALRDGVPLLLGAKPLLPSNPVVRTADLEIDPSQLDAYRAAVSEEIEASIRVEPGVGAIYAVAFSDAPNRIRFVEIYADESAYLAHRETPHFRKYLEVTGPMILSRTLIDATPVVIAARGNSGAVAGNPLVMR